jgi:DNA polymerase-3 subunit epsilon
MSLFNGTAQGLYAVVDIETTGGSPTRDRITEVAVFLFDGQNIVDEFHSLVNPEVVIPMSITQLTGISFDMVRDAPKFFEIAKRIVEITDGHIFVAHSVMFDYTFLKAEFKRLGYNYERKRLCTVRMSRRILPGHKSYSLGKLCADLGIEIRARHRAAGDALATAQLLGHLFAKDENGVLQTALKSGSREALMPQALTKKFVNSLPEATGVYYMHDREGRVIYVGKALNIRQRILGHFGVNLDSRKHLRLKDKVHDITYQLTGNELAALLLESHEIKTQLPLFNFAQKRARANYGLYEGPLSPEGYRTLHIARIESATEKLPLSTFTNVPAGRAFTERLVEKFNLCQKHTGLYPTDTSCFRYQTHRCLGACMGKEPPKQYNARLEKALNSIHLGNRSLALLERGRSDDERCIVWVQNGHYVGFGYFPADEPFESVHDLKPYVQPYPDNQDVQRILHHYLHSADARHVVEF